MQVYRTELRNVQEMLAQKTQQLATLQAQKAGSEQGGKGDDSKLAHMKDVAKKQQARALPASVLVQP